MKMENKNKKRILNKSWKDQFGVLVKKLDMWKLDFNLNKK